MVNITVKLETIEMMIFFWDSVAQREKISDVYINEIAFHKDMKALYDSKFDEKSVITVLSAITNRELLNTSSKRERKFWSQNMWMIDDRSTMKAMIVPIKTMNLDHLKDRLTKDIEVIFVPGTIEEFKVDENKLYINFFRIIASFEEPGKMTIAGVDFNQYIEEKVLGL